MRYKFTSIAIQYNFEYYITIMRTKFKSIFLFIFCSILVSGCASSSKNLAPVISAPTPTSEERPVSSNPPHKIALLLPMKGKYAEQSQAIRNGFMAAYYSGKLSQSQNGISIKIIDTSGKDINAVYDEVTSGGYDVIVGPLTKPDVKTLADRNSLSVPTLALNTLDNYQSKLTTNLYQFGLSPQDESLQAADKIFHDGHTATAIVTPNSSSAETIVNTFKNKYQSLGGKVITTANFYAVDYDIQVRELLGIDPAQLKHHKNNEPIKHRDDINAIFLVATPQQARLIAPLFKYYADDIKVYAVSNIYNGISQPNLDTDLNGVIFCDMPWVLKNPADLPSPLNDLHNKITTLWSGSFNNNAKLYALGIDAYQLATSDLNRLIASPSSAINGATGALSLDNYNHIYRELIWAEFQNGIPRIQ